MIRKERQLSVSEEERQKREEILRYQIEEIDLINPLPGEEADLNQEKKRLTNADRITNLVSEAYIALYEGSAGQLAVFDLLMRPAPELSDDEQRQVKNVAEQINHLAGEVASLSEDAARAGTLRQGRLQGSYLTLQRLDLLQQGIKYLLALRWRRVQPDLLHARLILV